MRLYAIYDKKACVFGEPLMHVNDAVMVRTLHQAFGSSDHPMARYPEDYDLYALGDYDQDTGHIGMEKPSFVCNLSVALRKE